MWDDRQRRRLNASRLRYFGGTTNHWGGHCAPLEPDDFEKHDWIAYSGWPYSYNLLRSYYVRAHEVLRIGEFDYDPEKMLQLSAWKHFLSTEQEL